MKATLTITFLMMISSVFSQQFQFRDLLEMVNDSKIFEVKMIRSLNQIHKKKESVTYSYTAENDVYGASPLMPTNNTKYEPVFRFDNGKIYSNSEIDRLNLDESFEIRNRLRKVGGLINKTIVDSFTFVKEKIISLQKYNNKEIGFAENYNQEEKKAATWYSWEQEICKHLKGKVEKSCANYNLLTIEYVRDFDYLNIVSQIVAKSKYLETKEEFGEFVSSYQFSNYTITSERREKGLGGIITIRISQK